MSVLVLKKIRDKGSKWLHAAPMINGIKVYNRSDRKRYAKKIKALVDTGADVSMVPQKVLDSLGIEPREDGYSINVMSANGDTGIYPCHHLDLGICKKVVDSEFALAWGQDFILLGRDVLTKSTLRVCWAKQKRGWLKIKSLHKKKSVRSKLRTH
jgi:gag-polyprotein putative aspartyl protease